MVKRGGVVKRGAGQVGGVVKRAEERHRRGVNLFGWGQWGMGLRVDGGWGGQKLEGKRGGGQREAEEMCLRNGFGWIHHQVWQ